VKTLFLSVNLWKRKKGK